MSGLQENGVAPAEFVYEAHPARVVFGAGARARLGEEVERLGLSRVLLVASPRLAAEARAYLGERAAAVIGEAVMHVPVEVASAAERTAAEARVDGLVAVGGGSAVGLVKAVARSLGLPILALPTTYAGSEMTSIWGLTEAGQKRTGREARVRPRTVIYDPELTRSMPRALAGSSGLNAVAHAMEALYAEGGDPLTRVLAEESVRAFAENLPAVAAPAGEPPSPAAHAGALYAAWLAGICLDRATMGVHHKLCHVLGGAFDLPHAAVHAVILPHAAAFNRAAAPAAMQRLARALSVPDAPRGLLALAQRVGAPASLRELGMKPGDLDHAADLATRAPYPNPRPVDRASIRALLADAYSGTLSGDVP